MLKIGKVVLNGAPKVVISFRDRVSSDVFRKIKSAGPDITELRIDQYSSFEPSYVLNEVKKFSQFSSLVTIRSKKEGGAWNLSEQKRLELFRTVMPYVNAADIELSSKKILKEVVSCARKAKRLVCVSYHNFDKTPSAVQLAKILKDAKDAGADIVKIAVLALKKEDVQLLADFTLANRKQNLVTISMGAKGVVSRIFFPALGSLLTYTSLGSPVAPGQLDYATTVGLLRKLYPKN